MPSENSEPTIHAIAQLRARQPANSPVQPHVSQMSLMITISPRVSPFCFHGAEEGGGGWGEGSARAGETGGVMDVQGGPVRQCPHLVVRSKLLQQCWRTSYWARDQGQQRSGLTNLRP